MVFSGTCYLTPLLGGWLADTKWDRYHTILRFSSVYFIGLVLLAVSSVKAIANDYSTIFALLLVSLGTGGIKSSVSVLGAEQTDDTEQQQSFFNYVRDPPRRTSPLLAPLLLPPPATPPVLLGHQPGLHDCLHRRRHRAAERGLHRGIHHPRCRHGPRRHLLLVGQVQVQSASASGCAFAHRTPTSPCPLPPSPPPYTPPHPGSVLTEVMSAAWSALKLRGVPCCGKGLNWNECVFHRMPSPGAHASSPPSPLQVAELQRRPGRRQDRVSPAHHSARPPHYGHLRGLLAHLLPGVCPSYGRAQARGRRRRLPLHSSPLAPDNPPQMPSTFFNQGKLMNLSVGAFDVPVAFLQVRCVVQRAHAPPPLRAHPAPAPSSPSTWSSSWSWCPFLIATSTLSSSPRACA